MSGIGTRLKQERKRLGLSQRELGHFGGVAANAQGKYESGERVPKADYLAAVANVGVDVLYVLTCKRMAGMELDTVINRMSGAGHPPDDIFIEVQHAVRHLVTTIEELSTTYDTSRQPQDTALRDPVTAER
ncbi:helix-turn-helix transcriptional regulator [Pseudomonas viridiflava]|uniref:DNA-binding protein n=1 Tax=Pseudomonas viridiflava TaxID=33069 RepID=A0A3M5PF22_PSEVI|nr:helix-turn-helix transcriptional regulator [Pseudomonas viridiflava]MBA1229008.1 helix-turn-helix transcriptional regulator [Pseudomonas viridiflava]RMT83191.1 DNA-binding protein [Pseudomonas viridiflava]